MQVFGKLTHMLKMHN